MDAGDCNLYTATSRGLVPGIEIDHSTSCVRLGESGRERVEVWIPVAAGIERENVAGRIRIGLAAVRMSGPYPSFVEYRPGTPEMVRVRTESVYTRGSPGSLCLLGAARQVAAGAHAWGDAGRVGSHPDALIEMPPGSAVRAVFSGGRGKGQGARWILTPPGLEWPRLVDLGESARPELTWPSVGLTQADLAWLAELVEVGGRGVDPAWAAGIRAVAGL